MGIYLYFSTVNFVEPKSLEINISDENLAPELRLAISVKHTLELKKNSCEKKIFNVQLIILHVEMIIMFDILN